MSVIIAGGGMSGATLALALAHLTRGRLAVHLVESRPPGDAVHPGYDARAIALAYGTQQRLMRFGIWQAIADVGTPIHTVHVSDRGHAGAVTLEAQDYHIDALGQVVELHEVGQRLFSLLRHAPGVTLHCPATVARVDREPGCVTVTLDSGDALVGQLLVATDGARSPIAAQLGVTYDEDDYQQVAAIANVTTAEPHRGRAFERFTEYGPLALLPMSQGRSSLVWCHSRERQHDVLSWSDRRFCEELQRAFGWRLGRITHAGARSVYPLSLIRAGRPFSHRLVLAGNAAQTLHPIAGQGFNLGLRDAISLAENLTTAMRHGSDIGRYEALNVWQQQRQADKEATITMTDGLVHLFANRWSPLVAGRNLGLMAMEFITPARDVLATRTLGWVAR